MIAALDAKEGAEYRLPHNRDQAMKTPWFIARIVSIDGLAAGHVLTSGGLRVASAAVWVWEGDKSVTGNVTGEEDRQFVHADHRFDGVGF